MLAVQLRGDAPIDRQALPAVCCFVGEIARPALSHPCARPPFRAVGHMGASLGFPWISVQAAAVLNGGRPLRRWNTSRAMNCLRQRRISLLLSPSPLRRSA